MVFPEHIRQANLLSSLDRVTISCRSADLALGVLVSRKAMLPGKFARWVGPAITGGRGLFSVAWTATVTASALQMEWGIQSRIPVVTERTDSGAEDCFATSKHKLAHH